MAVCNLVYAAALLSLAKGTGANKNMSCSTSAICENGGTCDSQLVCLCKAGYRGDRCQIGPDCGDGWTLNGSRCYRYFAEKTSWNDAKRTCESSNSRLVSVENRTDVEFVTDLVAAAAANATTGPSVWIIGSRWSSCRINTSVGANTENASGSNETFAGSCNDTTDGTAGGCSSCNRSISTAACTNATSSTNVSIDSYCTAMSGGNCLADSCEAVRSFVCSRGLGCDALSPPFHGSISGRGVGYGSVVMFSCNDSGGWTLQGSSFRECKFDGSWSGTGTTCAKMPTKEPNTAPENATQKLSLTTKTTISLSISLAGHVLTVLAYLIFTNWLWTIHSKSVFISSLFIGATLVLFIANGSNRGTNSHCLATSVLLHFFWLFTSVWTVVNAIAIVLTMKGKGDRDVPKFAFRAFLVVFCVSGCIVLLTMGLDVTDTYDRSKQDDFCGPAGLGLEYGVLTPVLFFLVIGCVVFVAGCVYLVMKMALLSSSQKLSYWLYVIGGALQTVLLLMSWVSMAVFASAREDYAYETRNSAQELLQVTAPLLGILTFVFNCLLHSEVIGTLKKRLRLQNNRKSSSPRPEADDGKKSLIAVNKHALETDNKTESSAKVTSPRATVARGDSVQMKELVHPVYLVAEV
ncbi:uncharacterized protein LOC134179940 isoform X2 [Corticium candelabrum]|uniref:uncharacterized protein LOC134179940 isoform X2 n=1 Tax=Corticium candelabrum TaxID=121492 RepID=UPI002E261905|nr:uncharacterized protein LOC134179940 isoform X2 [Corticium candelabrum]